MPLVMESLLGNDAYAAETMLGISRIDAHTVMCDVSLVKPNIQIAVASDRTPLGIRSAA